MMLFVPEGKAAAIGAVNYVRLVVMLLLILSMFRWLAVLGSSGS